MVSQRSTVASLPPVFDGASDEQLVGRPELLPVSVPTRSSPGSLPIGRTTIAAWRRSSSSSAAPGPDWEPGRPLEEQRGWDAHAAFMEGLVDTGFVVLGGPLADEHRVILAVEAASEDDVRATLARDPWAGSHLVVESVELWTIRLDGRTR